MFETIPQDFRAAAVTRAFTMIRTALRVLNIRTVGANRLPGPTFCLVGRGSWAMVGGSTGLEAEITSEPGVGRSRVA
jgi:hypothetical protein